MPDSVQVKPLPSVVMFGTVTVSGLFGWCIVHPFSTLTIRMNLANSTESVHSKLSFTSFVQQSIKKDGFKSLYHGLSAGLLRQFFYATSIFGLFEVFRDELAKHREMDFASRMLCGVASGGCAALITCPAEVALVRISNDVTLPKALRRNYTGVGNAMIRIVKEEGVRGLFHGCGPFANRAMVVGAVQLGTNDQFKGIYKSLGIVEEKWNVFLSSVTAALLYASLTMPFESAKNRMASQKPDPVTNKMKYTSALQTMGKVIKQEGVFGLWSGFPPYYLRCGIHTVVMFNTIEFLRTQYRQHFVHS